MTSETSTRRGGTLMWVVIAAGIAVVALGIVFAGRFGSDPTVTQSPLIDRPAPDVEMASFDGGDAVRLSDYRGDIVVVNFWASWCLSCRAEHDALLRAAANYEDLGVAFVAVNYQDAPGPATGFLADLGRSEQTVYVVDEGSRTAFEFGVLGLPETFFIDRSGIIVGKVSGPVTYELLAATIESIALGEVIGDVKTGEVENR